MDRSLLALAAVVAAVFIGRRPTGARPAAVAELPQLSDAVRPNPARWSGIVANIDSAAGLNFSHADEETALSGDNPLAQPGIQAMTDPSGSLASGAGATYLRPMNIGRPKRAAPLGTSRITGPERSVAANIVFPRRRKATPAVRRPSPPPLKSSRGFVNGVRF